MSVAEAQLAQMAELVKKAVEVILDPESSPVLRAEAQSYHDNVRTTMKPQDLISLGFRIIGTPVSPAVFHAALQFIQYSVNYHWNQFTAAERSSIKDIFLQNIRNKNPTPAGNSILDAPFLQETFARVIVDIAKKEWPQLWPDMLPNLIDLTKNSNVPFLVLRRLVEDVVTLGTVDSQQRKTELMQTLNLTANETVNHLFKSMSDAIIQYHGSGNPVLGTRIEIILSVITAYFEWVNTSHILTGDRIPVLLRMLQLKQFRILVAECLIQLLERKSTKREQEVTRAFLTDEACHEFKTSISTCGTEESDLTFLQKIGEVLMLLGTTVQVGSLKEVENFSNSVLVLAHHGNIHGLVSAGNAYNNFIKTEERQPPPRAKLVPYLKDLISTTVEKFLTTPVPSERAEMVTLKTGLSLLVRHASRMDPQFYLVVNQWYHQSLQSASPIPFFQWDILATIFEGVTAFVPQGEDRIVDTGLTDLQLALKRFSTESDLTLKSSYLSVVSSLFAFLDLANSANRFVDPHLLLMKGIFSSMFAIFTFTPPAIELSEAEYSLRSHTASLLIKLALKFKVLLSRAFDFLYELATVNREKMKGNEIQSAMECLFIVANTWKNYDRQKQLIESYLGSNSWVEMQELLQTPEIFLNFLEGPDFTTKKGVLNSNLQMLSITVRRVGTIEVDGGTPGENRHPAFEISLQLLPTIFQYVKMIHSIIELPQFQNALDITEAEKSQVMGIMHLPGEYALPTPRVLASKNNPNRPAIMRFMHSTVEASYAILGMSCYSFRPHIYNIPNIHEALLNAIGWKMNLLPDYRLRSIFRGVYRPFLTLATSTHYEQVVVPFLRAIGPFMFERLATRWQQVQAAAANADGDEEGEVIQNAVLCLLTREYLETINLVMESSSSVEAKGDMVGEDVEMDASEEIEDGGGASKAPRPPAPLKGHLSELGILLLNDPICFQSIIHLCGMALCWNDSTVSHRAGRCLVSCWEFIAPHQDVIIGVFTNTLHSVCIWTEFEANVDVLARLIDLVYINFHKAEPRVAQMLLEWGAAEDDLRKLSSSMAIGHKNDKKRKDIIRRMVKNNPNLDKNKNQKPAWLAGMPKLAPTKQKMDAEDDIDLNDVFALVDTLGP